MKCFQFFACGGCFIEVLKDSIVLFTGMATVASPLLGITRLRRDAGEVKADICARVQEADDCNVKLSSFLGERPSSLAEKILVVGLVLLCLCNLFARAVCNKLAFS